MEKVLLKPLASKVQYQGHFKALAWNLFSQPIPTYQSLLKHLGKYGLSLKDLKVDIAVLGEANISAYLLGFGASIGIWLDRFEGIFFKLHEVGEDLAHQVVLDLHAAIQEADGSAEVTRHTVDLTVETEIINTTHRDLLGRYLKVPAPLGDKVDLALGLFFKPDPNFGVQEGWLLLDRVRGQDHWLTLKLTATFDAIQVPTKVLRQRTADYLQHNLAELGLSLQTEEQR